MYLQHWKYEIIKDKETGRFCVRNFSVIKGRYGGGVVAIQTLFESDNFDECAAFCREHNIRIHETRGTGE